MGGNERPVAKCSKTFCLFFRSEVTQATCSHALAGALARLTLNTTIKLPVDKFIFHFSLLVSQLAFILGVLAPRTGLFVEAEPIHLYEREECCPENVLILGDDILIRPGTMRHNRDHAQLRAVMLFDDSDGKTFLFLF
jgi:hypothetical protein